MFKLLVSFVVFLTTQGCGTEDFINRSIYSYRNLSNREMTSIEVDNVVYAYIDRLGGEDAINGIKITFVDKIEQDGKGFAGLYYTTDHRAVVAFLPQMGCLADTALQHELNHARLRKGPRKGDPGHVDPSWKEIHALKRDTRNAYCND